MRQKIILWKQNFRNIVRYCRREIKELTTGSWTYYWKNVTEFKINPDDVTDIRTLTDGNGHLVKSTSIGPTI